MYKALLENILEKLKDTLEALEESVKNPKNLKNLKNPQNSTENTSLLREIAHDSLLIINLILNQVGEEEAKKTYQEFFAVRAFIAHQIFIVYLNNKVAEDIFKGNLEYFQQLIPQFEKLIVSGKYDSSEFHNKKMKKGKLSLTEKDFLEKCWHALERLKLAPVTLENVDDFLEGVYVLVELAKNNQYKINAEFKRLAEKLNHLRNFVEHHIFEDFSSEITRFSTKDEYRNFAIQRINDRHQFPLDQIQLAQLAFAQQLNALYDRSNNQSIVTYNFIPSNLKEFKHKIVELRKSNEKYNEILNDVIFHAYFKKEEINKIIGKVNNNEKLLLEVDTQSDITLLLKSPAEKPSILYYNNDIIERIVQKVDKALDEFKKFEKKGLDADKAASTLLFGLEKILFTVGGNSEKNVKLIDGETYKKIEQMILDMICRDKEKSRMFVEIIVNYYIDFVGNTKKNHPDESESEIKPIRDKLSTILFVYFDLKALYRDAKAVYQEDQKELLCLLRNIDNFDFFKKALATGGLDPNAIFSSGKILEISLVDFMLSYFYPMDWVVEVVKSPNFDPNHFSNGLPISFALNAKFAQKEFKNTPIGQPDKFYNSGEVTSFLHAIMSCNSFDMSVKVNGRTLSRDLDVFILNQHSSLEELSKRWESAHLSVMLDFFMKKEKDFLIRDENDFSLLILAFDRKNFDFIRKILSVYQDRCLTAIKKSIPDVEEIKQLSCFFSDSIRISFCRVHRDSQTGKITSHEDKYNLSVINNVLAHIIKINGSKNFFLGRNQILTVDKIIEGISSQEYALDDFFSRSQKERLYFYVYDYFKNLGLPEKLYEKHELFQIKITPEQDEFIKEMLPRLKVIKNLLDLQKKIQPVGPSRSGLFADKEHVAIQSNIPVEINPDGIAPAQFNNN